MATINKFDKSSGFIVPAKHYAGLTGPSAKFALSKNDYFAGITFLCEWITRDSFYHDPASGGNKGVLINTHPGITLTYQTKRLDKIFAGTSAAPIVNEIKGAIKSGNITPNMRNTKFSPSDYYKMFQAIEPSYTNDAYKLIRNNLERNKFASEILSGYKKGTKEYEDMKTRLTQRVVNQLPASAFSVIQQGVYKCGSAGFGRFKTLLNGTISAGLDLQNQDRHLQENAKSIVYTYSTKSGRKTDTRVMEIHRLFYVSGKGISPKLGEKIVDGIALTPSEMKQIQELSKKAGITNIVKGNKTVFSDISTDFEKGKNINYDSEIANTGIKDMKTSKLIRDSNKTITVTPPATSGKSFDKPKNIGNNESITAKYLNAKKVYSDYN